MATEGVWRLNEYESVSFRILPVKLEFIKVKVCVVVAYRFTKVRMKKRGGSGIT